MSSSQRSATYLDTYVIMIPLSILRPSFILLLHVPFPNTDDIRIVIESFTVVDEKVAHESSQ